MGEETLPDYLERDLDIVFVGLNPGLISVQAGCYFASPRNRFWPAINRSGLLEPPLGSTMDHEILRQRMDITDVVKRPSRGAYDLRAADFCRWAPVLKEKLSRLQPRIVCFHGAIAYRNYRKYAYGVDARPELGLQSNRKSCSLVFLVPNPSLANAVYSFETFVSWYSGLKALRDCLARL